MMKTIKVKVKYIILTEAYKEIEIDLDDSNLSTEELYGEIEDELEYQNLNVKQPLEENMCRPKLYINDILVKDNGKVVMDYRAAIRSSTIKDFLED